MRKPPLNMDKLYIFRLALRFVSDSWKNHENGENALYNKLQHARNCNLFFKFRKICILWNVINVQANKTTVAKML